MALTKLLAGAAGVCFVIAFFEFGNGKVGSIFLMLFSGLMLATTLLNGRKYKRQSPKI